MALLDHALEQLDASRSVARVQRGGRLIEARFPLTTVSKNDHLGAGRTNDKHQRRDKRDN